MFNHYNHFYVFIRMLNFFLLVCSVIGFFFIFFWGIFHNNDYVVTNEHHHILFQKYNEDYIYDSWSFLLYGVFFYLDLSEIWVELFPLKSNAMLRKNLRSCCHLPFYIVLIMTCSLRLALLFTIDNADLVMNMKYAKELLAQHPTSYNLQYGLFIAYCAVVIFNCLILLNCLYIVFFHPRMKKEAMVQCVNPDSKLVRWLHLTPKDMIKPIEAKIHQAEEWTRSHLLHAHYLENDPEFLTEFDKIDRDAQDEPMPIKRIKISN